MLEKAKWITGEGNGEGQSACFFFRRTFLLREEIESAQLHCAALPMGELRVNGKLPPNFYTDFSDSDPTYAICCRSYEVGALLSKGENLLTVTLPKGGRFCAELSVTLKGGRVASLCSDSSWCVTDKTPFLAVSAKGEVYDEGKYNPDYYLPSYNDAAWDNAKITAGTGGLLLPLRALPVCQEPPSIPAKRLQKGVYDFTHLLVGRVSLRIEGRVGDRIRIYYGKRLQKNGLPLFEKGTDDFILGYRGARTYTATFSKHCFRYVKAVLVESAGEKPAEPHSVSAVTLHTALDSIGYFACSNDNLTAWHEHICRSLRLAWQGAPTFIPEREEFGRCAVGFATAGASLYNFDMKAPYRKWLSDILDAQRPDGQFPAVLPCTVKYADCGSAADGAALLLLPYEYYLYTGDSSLLSLAFGGMKAYMRFLTQFEEEGILHFGDRDIHLRREAAYCPPELPGTALYYRFAEVMARTATLLGESPKEYEALATKVRAAFRERFMKNGHLLFPSQTAIACTLAMHLAEEDEEAELTASLLAAIREAEGFDVGMMGLGFLLAALGEAGKIQEAYNVIAKELSDKDGKGAHASKLWSYPAHCEIDRFLFRYIAGIRPTPHSLTVAPFLPEGMEYVLSSYGDVYVEVTESRIHIISRRPFYLKYGGGEHYLPAGEYNFSAKK